MPLQPVDNLPVDNFTLSHVGHDRPTARPPDRPTADNYHGAPAGENPLFVYAPNPEIQDNASYQELSAHAMGTS